MMTVDFRPWGYWRAALGLGLMSRRFPQPWSVEETEACFIPGPRGIGPADVVGARPSLVETSRRLLDAGRCSVIG
jgi:hypothetical protein